MTPKFLRDLADGGVGEDRVIAFFKACGWPTDKVDPADKNTRRYYDLEVAIPSVLTFTTEVKYDKYEARSGNVAIEIWNPKLNQPSGLNITKADFWCHVLQDSAWITSVETLKGFTEANKPFRYIECGGDDNSTMLLYRRDDVLPVIFNQMDTMTPEDLRNLIWKHFR